MRRTLRKYLPQVIEEESHSPMLTRLPPFLRGMIAKVCKRLKRTGSQWDRIEGAAVKAQRHSNCEDSSAIGPSPKMPYLDFEHVLIALKAFQQPLTSCDSRLASRTPSSPAEAISSAPSFSKISLAALVCSALSEWTDMRIRPSRSLPS